MCHVYMLSKFAVPKYFSSYFGNTIQKNIEKPQQELKPTICD